MVWVVLSQFSLLLGELLGKSSPTPSFNPLLLLSFGLPIGIFPSILLTCTFGTWLFRYRTIIKKQPQNFHKICVTGTVTSPPCFNKILTTNSSGRGKNRVMKVKRI
ncbi:hypothetical protein J6590_081816 [Homalodisca vitripennis]|nr:hypothetical protein J6590_081816 [Homalodisca vitripennis]